MVIVVGKWDVGIAWLMTTLLEKAGFLESMIRHIYFLAMGEVIGMSTVLNKTFPFLR